MIVLQNLKKKLRIFSDIRRRCNPSFIKNGKFLYYLSRRIPTPVRRKNVNIFVGKRLTFSRGNENVILKVQSGISKKKITEHVLTKCIVSKIPEVTAVVDIFEKKDNSYIVAKQYDMDLFDFVDRNLVTKDNIYPIFKNIVEKVNIMHKNSIYHRDIKLENIVINITETNGKETYDIRFIDFESITVLKKAVGKCGTCFRSPPEMYYSGELYSEAYDCEKSDCFSLGVILFSLLYKASVWDKKNLYLECYLLHLL